MRLSECEEIISILHPNLIVVINIITHSLYMATPVEEVGRKCQKGHEIPKIPFILRSFSLEITEVCAIYVVGSHLWQSCHKNSDWDLVIIVKNPLYEALNAHKGNIDVWILSADEYSGFIKDHLIQALITVWVPDSLVLFTTNTFNPRRIFSYSSMAIQLALDKLYERDVRVAEKHFVKGDPKGGVKVIKHLLRQLTLSSQVIEHGKIIEYTSNEDEDYFQLSYCSWEDILSMVQLKRHEVVSKIS